MAKISGKILRKIRGDSRASYLDCRFQVNIGEEIRLNGKVYLSNALTVSTQSSSKFIAHNNANALSPTKSPTKPKRKNNSVSVLKTGPYRSQLEQGSIDTSAAQMDDDALHLQLSNVSSGGGNVIVDTNSSQHNIKSTNAPTSPHSYGTIHFPTSPTSPHFLQKEKEHTPNNTLQHSKHSEKTEMAPMRRSPRLQAKQKKECSRKELSPKPKSRIEKLPFDLDTRDSPLDAEAVLTILQATGMQINGEIRQMIQDALTENPTENSIEIPNPGTPLHDATLPLLIPGEDMVL